MRGFLIAKNDVRLLLINVTITASLLIPFNLSRAWRTAVGHWDVVLALNVTADWGSQLLSRVSVNVIRGMLGNEVAFGLAICLFQPLVK